jgi:hypothetical protein
MLLIIIISIKNLACFTDCVFYAKDTSVDLHGHVSIGKEAAVELSKGISSVGSQIGSGAAIVGVAGVVGKSIAKSSLPPIQKAVVITGSALIGGLIHSGTTHINRANVLENMSKTSYIPKDTSINKLVGDISSSDSPLEGLLFSIEGINYICFALVVILIIQLYIRLHIKNDINIPVLGITLNKYINKLIVLNKKVSVIYI